MNSSSEGLKILKAWKAGDTRPLSEKTLRQAQLEGRYDSYAQVYQLDGLDWKVQSQMSYPSGETIYTLVCVNE